MESVNEYFNQLINIINKNNFIGYKDISFRQIAEREAYIRGELYIYGGSVLHVAEYIVIDDQGIVSRLKYRYQLQDKNNTLIARWDNAPHHSEIGTPFHKHCGDGKIISSVEMNIQKLLAEELDTILAY